VYLQISAGELFPLPICDIMRGEICDKQEFCVEAFMRNYEIENEMYRRAVELIEKRYPVGWGGAGVVHTAKGNYFTSVCIETANASAELCIETGAMLEAHKFNERVTHCLCLVREDERSRYRVLSPCGICQERLRYWGDDVQVAVTTDEEELKFVYLRELQPYHWTKAYPARELEHWEE
jgi:cytidine deaminase